jgi:hypothetical protein
LVSIRGALGFLGCGSADEGGKRHRIDLVLPAVGINQGDQFLPVLFGQAFTDSLDPFQGRQRVGQIDGNLDQGFLVQDPVMGNAFVRRLATAPRFQCLKQLRMGDIGLAISDRINFLFFLPKVDPSRRNGSEVP